MKYSDAINKLTQMGYAVVKVTEGDEVIGLEVFSSALVMDSRERLIREVLPDFRVFGIKHLERIEINL